VHKYKHSLLAAAMVAALGATTVPVSAATVITVAPPALRAETVPPARAGYAWVPGYWNWNGHRHVWVAGNWVRERRGYAYNAPHWVEHDGRWNLERGNWSRRDSDGDGVPNRADSHPNNSHRS